MLAAARKVLPSTFDLQLTHDDITTNHQNNSTPTSLHDQAKATVHSSKTVAKIPAVFKTTENDLARLLSAYGDCV